MSFQSDFFKACGFQAGQKWDLLYRANGNEYTGYEFVSHCAGKSPTLIIIKAHNGTIVGGYTEMRWERLVKLTSDAKAFVFRKSPHESQFELFKRNAFELMCEGGAGPAFYGSFGFRVTSDAALLLFKSSGSTGEQADRFMISSIEVFRKVKKRVDFLDREGSHDKESRTKYKSIQTSLKIWG